MSNKGIFLEEGKEVDYFPYKMASKIQYPIETQKVDFSQRCKNLTNCVYILQNKHAMDVKVTE